MCILGNLMCESRGTYRTRRQLFSRSFSSPSAVLIINMSGIPQVTITKSLDDMVTAAPAQVSAQAGPSTVATSIISLPNPEVLQVIDLG